MRVFLTGATGFIGSRIVPELIGAGHSVLGLTRSEAGAAALAAAGAEVHRGDIEDLDSLRAGAAAADAAIHTAFDHDFSNFVDNCEKDRRVITAMGEVLKGSDRPFLITSGVGMGGGTPGKPATEDVFDRDHPNPRSASEEAGETLKAQGVDVRVIRLPQVHDTVKQGLITPLIEITRQKGVSAYLGDGLNRWSAGHVEDVAALYRLALEKGTKNARYNAVAEEGVTARAIAEVLGEGLNLPVVSLTPEEAPAHFGWMAIFAGLDMAASSALTREALAWTPTGPGLIADLKAMDYSAA
ncbi:SDR family oxidoreductase [Brevundimonas goettingensis]|uniref:SDR family oxidoreductase n=1 Tax=Brevundimonas goettingensis TaxID=2774190 RepID=A0A975C018_9CAUL|nr:SDR family oxidoreductase [Brevundimonas goettingensis]QTC91278.1 SDR family oxidoreductase [Brevundimonas goettingensis]